MQYYPVYVNGKEIFFIFPIAAEKSCDFKSEIIC